MLSFRIIGLEKVVANLKDAADIRHYAKAVDETIAEAVRLAKEYAPVSDPSKYSHSGTLEASIYAEGGTIVADAPWAVFNEYGCWNIEVGTIRNPKGSISGSGKFAYRPFLRPALYQAIDNFPERLFSKFSATKKGMISITAGRLGRPRG
jgi:hypothetical protein